MKRPANDRLLRALLREPVDRTPVWLMRQAGRYLPEYRKLREQAGDFMALCSSPELACEVTLQPLRRFPLDAAILFSDILTIPDAMGLGLFFETGEGPRFRHPVRDRRAIDALPVPDPHEALQYVVDAVARIRRELDGKLPLIGFAGSPWTVATYMVEGRSSKTFATIKRMLYAAPDDLHALLAKVAGATAAYLNAQIEAGADAVMLFDTWGGALAPAAYREFSLRHMEEIVARLSRERDGERIPVVLFTKGGGPWLADMAATGCDALGVDWTTDLATARAAVGDRVALQGNLDPSVLYAPPAVIRDAARGVLNSFGSGSGHVFNLGHGLHPGIDPDHVAALVDAVHEFSPPLHRL